jgi:hypothetical protein
MITVGFLMVVAVALSAAAAGAIGAPDARGV